jgi:cell division protein FtsQ
MWDNTQALRQLANMLLGISLLLIFFGALHYALHLPIFALRAVQLSTAPKHIDTAQIEAVVRNELRGNFFTVDLDATRQAFEKLPWVRTVSVRRSYPWQLEVTLEEHIALAKWNNSGLVNTFGEVFAAETDQALPSFIGQPDSAAEITQQFHAFSKQLAPLQQQQLTQVSLSPRRAWQLRLSNGMMLELGREQVQQRLARFVEVYPYSLAPLEHKVNYVDLRYRNGFAVHWPGATGRVDNPSTQIPPGEV